jgi:hypothetical protein
MYKGDPMTHSAVAYNTYDKSEMIRSLELLYNNISIKIDKINITIKLITKKIKQPALNPRKACFKRRISKLYEYRDKCKNMNLELRNLIYWVESEQLCMGNNIISLRLYNAIFDVVQKINEEFPMFGAIAAYVLQLANKQVWGNYYNHNCQRNSTSTVIPDDFPWWATQEFQQGRVIDLFR